MRPRRRPAIAFGWRLLYAAVPFLLWAVYAALIVPYTAIRSVGDDLFPWHDGASFELGPGAWSATQALQEALYSRDLVWLDFAGFLLHIGWFFVPLAFAVALVVLERRRLMEYFGWLLAAAYVSTLGYLLFPLTPPWMSPGISRVLVDRSFIHYTSLDNNPVAAFPSLHAGLPLVIALFFFFRCARARRLGWVALVLALAVGFDVVYLGEHWVIDVLAGYALAGVVAFLFVHPAMRTLYARVPGDPIGRLARLNEVLCTRPPGKREAEAPGVPGEERRAA
jgi:membrane-associated phospholipid phosphatase